MKTKITILMFCIIYTTCMSQNQTILPRGFAPGEEALMDDYLKTFSKNSSRVTYNTPPTLPVRTAAQWEEVQALVITWIAFPAIHRQIVAAAQKECKVIIHCNDSLTVKSDLTSNGIPLTNVKFIETTFNSIWIRDYGANTCYLNDVDSLVLVDWIYNRPRPDDDQIPLAYANFLGLPLYRTTVNPTDLMNTGGNWMVDGLGTAFASELVLDENDGAGSFSLLYPNHSEPDINQIMSDFHGINRYIKMTVLPYDGIHHIDMHMKFLDEKTILVGKFPTGISDGPQLEANLQYVLNNFNDAWGNPYRIIRIPMVPSNSGQYAPSSSYRTYSNFVIANKTVIMPTYRQQYDTTAIRIIKENMPGYKVVTIDSDNNGNDLVAMGGVIHCITHTVGVKDPLRIVHNYLSDTYNSSTPYQINATVQHKTGIANAKVYWTIDTMQGYSPVNMTLTNASTDTWTGYIPAQTPGKMIYYYVQAQANNGKQQVRPITAPHGWWRFKILGVSGIEENLTNIFSEPVFPNPSKGITCIPVNSNRNITGSIYITDITGRKVQEIFSGNFKQGESKYFVNTINWEAGMYTIVAQTNEGTITQKLIVK